MTRIHTFFIGFLTAWLILTFYDQENFETFAQSKLKELTTKTEKYLDE